MRKRGQIARVLGGFQSQIAQLDDGTRFFEPEVAFYADGRRGIVRYFETFLVAAVVYLVLSQTVNLLRILVGALLFPAARTQATPRCSPMPRSSCVPRSAHDPG